MPGKYRKHTPYTSEAQTTAGNIALAAREGKFPKSQLKGASREMAKGMTMKELKSHSAEAKGKDLPYKKGKRKTGSQGVAGRETGSCPGMGKSKMSTMKHGEMMDEGK